MAMNYIQTAAPAGSAAGEGDASGRDVYTIGDVIPPDEILVTVAPASPEYADHVPRKFRPERVKLKRAQANSSVSVQIKIGGNGDGTGEDLFPGGAVMMNTGDQVTTALQSALDGDMRTNGFAEDARVDIILTLHQGYGYGTGDSRGLRICIWGEWLNETA